MNLEKIYRFLPFLAWLKELKNPRILKADILAGITVAFVVVPQSMAYAQLAGLPIQVGLYTAFLPVIIAGLFGSSRQMSTGPVTIVSLMTAATLAPLAISSPEGYAAYASLLAFFIGLFYLLLGNLRLGVVVEFLSHPVILGFTNAVAIITLTSQASKIFGITSVKGESYFTGVMLIVKNAMANTHMMTFIFGATSIIGLLILKRYFPKLPRVLIVLVVAIVASSFFNYAGFGGKIVGDIPAGLPSFDFIFFNQELQAGLMNFAILKSLFFSAVIIGLIGFTESISVAKFVGATTRQSVSPNRELFGQGMANLASSFFGGYGVAGSFSKTAVNLRAGAVTGLSSVVTGTVVAIVLVFFTGLLKNLPMATLAAIIIVSVSSLIKVKPIIEAWKLQKQDGIVGIVSFIATLYFAPNLEAGIFIGVFLSLLFFIFRTMKLRIVEVAKYKDGVLRDVDLFGLKTSKDVSVIRIEGNLYFANAGSTEAKILDLISTKKKLKYVILDLSFLTDIDSSGLYSFENLVFSLDKIGVKVYICGLKVHIVEKLHRAKFIKGFKKKNIFTKVKEALQKIEKREDSDIDLKSLLDYKPYKKLDDEGKEILKKYGG